MTAKVVELERALLKLDVRARARLAHVLLESLDPVTEVEAEALWAEEAQRRDDEVDSGAVAERSFDEVLREARALLK